MSEERVQLIKTEGEDCKFTVYVDRKDYGYIDVDYECSLVFQSHVYLSPFYMKLIANEVEAKQKELFAAGLLG